MKRVQDVKDNDSTREFKIECDNIYKGNTNNKLTHQIVAGRWLQILKMTKHFVLSRKKKVKKRSILSLENNG